MEQDAQAKVDLPGIYDLFAIRVILDSEPEREKAECWLGLLYIGRYVHSQPCPYARLDFNTEEQRYESLHATVMGPENKWVEVQFRTRRMDLVAEKGLARTGVYKGGALMVLTVDE